jgi:hypothetical protein
MSDNTATNSDRNVDLAPIEILLAESNPFEVDRIKSYIDREFQAGIRIAKSYDDLISQITEKPPQLVFLGKIDKFNYFDICKECQDIQAGLPIFLLSRQEVISDSFLKLAKTRGLTDIIDPDPVKLTQLLQTIERPDRQSQRQSPLEPIIVGSTMLAGMEEIIAISNNYFGPLAQGNYWRKAHAQTVDKFPFLSNWSADHFSKISCHESILNLELTAEDIESLRIWVQLFIEECERIIIDYQSILHNANLSSSAQDLLSKT